jgi:spore coat protein U-like protein
MEIDGDWKKEIGEEIDGRRLVEIERKRLIVNNKSHSISFNLIQSHSISFNLIQSQSISINLNQSQSISINLNQSQQITINHKL